MGRNSTVRMNPVGLRRLLSGAVLAFFAGGALGCGDGDNNPAGPGPEPPPDVGIAPSAGCTDGVLEHGGLYRICFPATWNGDLVLFAHGYIAPQNDLAIPEESIGGQPASSVITGMGYAYATTSFRANGLVADVAVDDMLELMDTVEQRYRPDPARAIVVGFSEGGLVATLEAERHADRFNGALAGCGPIGDFREQLDYIADFRVVFDYFYPGLIPGDALQVPESVRQHWNDIYTPAIVVAFAARPEAARQLFAVTGAPTAGSDIRSLAETAIGLLWYNAFGTADAQARLGGQPFDNSAQVYAGSDDDAALNAGIARYTADPAALSSIARFTTSGTPQAPLINLHTTGDPIVPFSQAGLYADKVRQAGNGNFTQVNVTRAGHCNFQASELLNAFNDLWQQIDNQPPTPLTLTVLP